MKRTRTIAITNQKGGVGKTTTTLSLASGLSRKGHSVLVIDLDPQGHCASAIGVEPAPGVFHLLTLRQSPQEQAFLGQFVVETPQGWSLISGNATTMSAQTILNAENRSISCIRDAILPFTRGSFDYIIFDTAPSVGGIQERAIWAADLVIVPAATEYLSTESVRKTMDGLLFLKQEKGWKGKCLGILPTFYHQQLREHRAALDDLRLGYGNLVLDPIHRSAALGECPGAAKNIFEKDPRSRAALEYQKLVDLVIRQS